MNQSDSVLSPQYKAPVLSENGSMGIRNLRSRNRFEATEFPSLGSRDEALIVDERLGLRPAQVVESKLTRLLQDASLARQPPPDEGPTANPLILLASNDTIPAPRAGCAFI